MTGERYLVDTNVLIRWVRREAAEFQLINTSMQNLAALRNIPCYTSQNPGEFWNVLTRPANRNGYGMSPEEADLRARDIEASLELLPDIPAVHVEWRKLLVGYRISGVQVHDARLAAIMRVHAVDRILTFNTKDFAHFEGIVAIDPRDLA